MSYPREKREEIAFQTRKFLEEFETAYHKGKSNNTDMDKFIENLYWLLSLERVDQLKIDCLTDTCDEIAELTGYKPDRDQEFSGDKLVEIIRDLIENQKRLTKSLGEMVQAKEKIGFVQAFDDWDGPMDDARNILKEIRGQNHSS